MTTRPLALDDYPGVHYCYTRCSTARQAESGLSLDAQQELLQMDYKLECARRRSAELTPRLFGGVFIDKAASAYKTPFLNRTAGRELNLRLRSGDHVAFAKLDRGFRNTSDMIHVAFKTWMPRGITVSFLDIQLDLSTSMGKFTATVIAAVAEWESARRGERVREAKQILKARGRITNGSKPYGYRVVRKRLHIDDEEGTVLAYIRGLREPANGAKPLSWDKMQVLFWKRRIRRGRGEWWANGLRVAYQAAVSQNITPIYEYSP